MELLTIKVQDIFDAILDNSRLLATTARLADHPHNNAGASVASVAAALHLNAHLSFGHKPSSTLGRGSESCLCSICLVNNAPLMHLHL